MVYYTHTDQSNMNAFSLNNRLHRHEDYPKVKCTKIGK